MMINRVTSAGFYAVGIKLSEIRPNLFMKNLSTIILAAFVLLATTIVLQTH